MRGVFFRPASLALALGLGFSAAQAQDRPDPQALRSSLGEMLSMLSFGAVSIPPQPAPVAQSNGQYHLLLPLAGFVAPVGATAEAVGRPVANGAWDVTSLALPPAGAFGASIDNLVSYTIGQQAMHGRIDPGLATASSFLAELRAVTLQTGPGGQDSQQAIGQLTLDSAVSPAASGRVDVLVRDTAANWHVVTRDVAGAKSESSAGHVDGHVSLHGLDRAQGMQFIAALRALRRTASASGRQPDAAVSERLELRDALNATTGLLARIDAEQTLDGIKFNLGSGSAGTLGRMRLQLNGNAEGQRLNAGLDIAMEGISVASMSAATASLAPRHLTAKSVLAGLPIGMLMPLLQAALGPRPDPAALQQQATKLLETPGARAAIESVAFDLGPLHVHGSARFVPRPNGEIGADIHVSASGADALLAEAQGKPALQGLLPMVFLAKGLGRTQGDSITWDISVGGGPLIVNGTPFGQPSARTR